MCQHKLQWNSFGPRPIYCSLCPNFISSFTSDHSCFSCGYHECDTCYRKKLEEQKPSPAPKSTGTPAGEVKFGGANCPFCTKTVYSAEPSVAADGNKFHESCFRRLESKRQLISQRLIIAKRKVDALRTPTPPGGTPIISINPKLAKSIEKIKPMNTESIDEKFYNASKSGKIYAVRHYLNMGANKNIIMTNGYTALMIASENGYLDIVQHLLSLKVNVDIKNKDNKCAMLLAKNNNILLEFI